MSFDLKITDNDLSINPDGTLQTVQENDKLVQDIVKAILTPLGSNLFFKWYGCAIGAKTIGQIYDETTIQMEVERSIQDTLTNIIALQQAQAQSQYVSAGETIAAIQNVSVMRSEIDPRQFEIYVSILTRKLTPLDIQFTLTV